MDIMDRLPPHNRDAERSLLGSMLRDNQIIPEVVNLVRAGNFYVYAHQKIFDAITKLNDDGGKPADLVTVAEWLSQEKLLDEIGGPAYLFDLWDAAPSAAHYHQYAEIIRQKAIVRNLIHACVELQAEAYDQTQDAADLLDSAERRIHEIAEIGATGDTATAQSTMRGTWERLNERCKNPGAGGVPTGFIDIDDILCGLRNRELGVLAARPSVGKSQFALMVAKHAAIVEQMPVLFTSLEQSRFELMERLLCCHAKVNSDNLRTGRIPPEDLERMMEANPALSEAPIFFDDEPGQNMIRIAANARRMKKRHGIRLMVVDYLQLIVPDDRRPPRNEQLAAISSRLKTLARELAIPVLALSQLNRESEMGHGSRPKLSQLGGSDNIGQDADMVMLLHRETEDDNGPTCLINVIVEKNRNGKRGEATLLYRKAFMEFCNWQKEHG